MNQKVMLYRAATAIACAVPRRPAYAAARGAGTVLSVLPSRRRAALRSNIAAAHNLDMNDRRVRRDTRRAFKHAMLNYVDLFRMARFDMPEFVDSIGVVDWRPYQEAHAKGKGVILVSAHLGNFDTVVQKLALRGVRCLIPVEAVDPPELLELVMRQRAAMGIDVVPVGPDTFRLLSERLREGGTIVVVSDRVVQGSGYETELFGREAAMPQAAIVLALRTGAPVLGAFGYRCANDSIVGRFTAELTFERLNSASGERRNFRDVLNAGMRELSALLEREIARDPGQWVVQQALFRPKLTLRRAPAAWSRACKQLAPHGLQGDAKAMRL